MKRRFTPKMEQIALAVALSTAACSGDPAVETPMGPMGPMEFEAVIDPSRGSFEITRFGDASSLRGLRVLGAGPALSPTVVVQDGVAGSGPANSVELVTTNVFQDPGGGPCGPPSSFCADVTIRSFYTGLTDVFAEITEITPMAGHTALNSDPPQFGLSDTLGLWSYGDLPNSGDANTVQWIFGDDGTPYVVRGRVMSNLCSNEIQDPDEDGVDCGGPFCPTCPACDDGIENGMETGIDCGGGCPNACVTVTFPLLPSQEVPAVTTSQARGSCTLELAGSQLAITVNCTHNVTSPTAAHIHGNAAAGVNAGVLFNLGTGASPIAATIPITATDAMNFLAGSWYVNVHSTTFANGEVRGQAANVDTFPLVPRQENPAVVNSNSFGSCTTFLSPGQTSLHVRCTHNIGATTAAHVHRAAPGVNGPVLFAMGTGASPINQTFTTTAMDASDYLNGNLYVNVHTAGNPNGEIRGQIGKVVESRGSGLQEVPANGSTATLRCRTIVSPNASTLFLSCTHNVAGTTAAHIHRGVPAVNGPVVFDLGTGASPINATITLAAGDNTDFLNGDFYVNVHSGAFPGGEVRAQIATNFELTMNGDQHVPTVATARSGQCTAHLIPTETHIDVACTHNVTDATLAHLHTCSGICSGPIFGANFPSAASPFSHSVPLGILDVAQLNLGNLYVHLHSTTFAVGELRGQIADHFDFTLNGLQVVPPNASVNTGRCLTYLGSNENPQMAFRCTHTIPNANSSAGRLNNGAVGVNGSVISTFSANGDSPINNTAVLSPVAGGNVRAGNTYVDITSTTFPAGEIRGQVVP